MVLHTSWDNVKKKICPIQRQINIGLVVKNYSIIFDKIDPKTLKVDLEKIEKEIPLENHDIYQP